MVTFGYVKSSLGVLNYLDRFAMDCFKLLMFLSFLSLPKYVLYKYN